MVDCTVRRMRLADVEAVSRIEAATFPRPWSESAFRQELERNVAARYLVALRGEEIVGYAGAWVILDESHITNIAVAEPWRGKGIGKELTGRLLWYLSNLGASYATLEVRVSNERAISLYRSLGFISVGKRKKYYEDNDEDAFLMVCDHLPPADPDFEEWE